MSLWKDVNSMHINIFGRDINSALRHRSIGWPVNVVSVKAMILIGSCSWVHDYQEACVAKVEEFMRHGMKSQPSQSNDESSSV